MVIIQIQIFINHHVLNFYKLLSDLAFTIIVNADFIVQLQKTLPFHSLDEQICVYNNSNYILLLLLGILYNSRTVRLFKDLPIVQLLLSNIIINLLSLKCKCVIFRNA